VIPNPGGSPSMTTGEFMSEPFQLPLLFNRNACPKPQTKGGKR
jgi:hypothetical protein